MINFLLGRHNVGCFRWSTKGLKADFGKIRGGLGETPRSRLYEFFGTAGQHRSKLWPKFFRARTTSRKKSIGSDLAFFACGLLSRISGYSLNVFFAPCGSVQHIDLARSASCVCGVGTSFNPARFGGCPSRFFPILACPGGLAMTMAQHCAAPGLQGGVTCRGVGMSRTAGWRSRWVGTAVSEVAGGNSPEFGILHMYVFISTVLCNGP